jgi:small-conductance mechanosensitive channel
VAGRRLLLILLSPLLVIVAVINLLLGLSFFSGTNPAILAAGDLELATVTNERLLYRVIRCLLLPFQLVFIGLTLVVALWIFRQRHRIAAWIIGEPIIERLASTEGQENIGQVSIRAERRRTWHQLLSRVIALIAIIGGLLFILGQFIPRSELAVVVTALTGSLAWGARLPISDLLGDITSIFEDNYKLGDRIQFKQLDKAIEGVVEHVVMRFVSVRADSGELVTIPHGDLRIFRNKSAGKSIGVYATIPLHSSDLGGAVQLLESLAPRWPEFVPHLTEPWQSLSEEGQMRSTVNLSLFGKTQTGREDDLQLVLYRVVQSRLEEIGIEIQSVTEQG